jgi:hypothetical protein
VLLLLILNEARFDSAEKGIHFINIAKAGKFPKNFTNFKKFLRKCSGHGYAFEK